MQFASHPLRVLIHAPTAGAVARARNNAANLLKAAPDCAVLILVNADGVATALDTPRPDTDCVTLLCENTLQRIQRVAPEPFRTVSTSILAIAEMQREGWCYVRA